MASPPWSSGREGGSGIRRGLAAPAGPWGAGGGGAGEGQGGGDLGRCRAPEVADLPPRDLDRPGCSLALSGSDP